MDVKKKRISLFSRIFGINMLIIFISFTLMSVICYSRLYSYLKSDYISRILTASSKMLDITRQTDELYSELDILQSQGDISYYNYNKIKGQINVNYKSTITTIASSTNFSVMKLSPDNRILYRYADIQAFRPNTILRGRGSEYETEYIVPSAPLSKILEGKIPAAATAASYSNEEYYVIWGTMDKLFVDTTLTVFKPIYKNNALDYVLLLFIPTPQINSLLNVIASNFILATLISLFVSVALSYALTYRISKPLKDMNDAAMKIASGDFTKRVNTDCENTIGEISELITTFNDMAESLQNTEENQRAFTASIAHELRTPMTSIIGFTDSILDGTIPPEKVNDYLEICLSEERRLSRLVTELMDVSRIESGGQKLEYASFDINECIRRQIIKYEERITEKQIDVNVEFETEQCFCLCDKDAITRVIINLLDNAIKFTPQNGFIKIAVGAKSSKIYVSFENSGDGIASDDLKHIFDKFYKTDKSRGIDKKGIGLGLYLVKNIMLLHGESIEAKSEPGQFTRFTFTLKPCKSNSNK